MIQFWKDTEEISIEELHSDYFPESSYSTFFPWFMEQIETGRVHCEDSSVDTLDEFCKKRRKQRKNKIVEQLLDQYMYSLGRIGKKQRKQVRKNYRESEQFLAECREAFEKDESLKKWTDREYQIQQYQYYLEKCKSDLHRKIKRQVEEYFIYKKEEDFQKLDFTAIYQKHRDAIIQSIQSKLDQALADDAVFKYCEVEEYLERFQDDPECAIADLLYEDDFFDFYIVELLFQMDSELNKRYESEEDITLFMEIFGECFDIKYDILKEIDDSSYHILQCLMKNPYCRDDAILFYEKKRKELDSEYYTSEEILEMKKRQQEREQFLKNSILSSIPKMYKDLYPIARQIQRRFVLHIGPTNSGKTFHAMQALRKNGSGIYLAPLRLLAFEQFENMNKDGFVCDLITGEEKTRVPFSTYQSSTIEVADYSYHYTMAVIDEAQMVEDEERGGAWTSAILGLCADEIHICAAPYALDRIIKLIKECGDSYEVVEHKRDTKLVMEKAYFHFPEDVREKDALIVFSKRNVHAVASELQRMGRKCSIIYGNLPYDVRQEEARKFLSGETEILVSTDAIGMGMNLPIRRIVFLETSKYDGKNIRPLKAEEIQQIAGRAGRKGMYEVGFVNAEENKKLIQRALETEVPPILTAVITFPESLIGIDAPLSETLERWNNIRSNAGYEKENIVEQIQLCRELEAISEDKKLIYDFITIPFDGNHTESKQIWYTLFQDEMKGNEYNYKRFLPEIEYKVDPVHLNDLEEAYKICDLLYFYMDRFHGQEDFEDITELKKSISSQIIKILKKQKLVIRKCRKCKLLLPWNHNYSICESCYRKQKENYAWKYMYW